MPLSRILGGSLAVAEKALDLCATRQGFIQSNIVNINTPGYSTQDFDFKRLSIQRAISAQPALSIMEPPAYGRPVALTKSLSFGKGKRQADIPSRMLTNTQNRVGEAYQEIMRMQL